MNISFADASRSSRAICIRSVRPPVVCSPLECERETAAGRYVLLGPASGHAETYVDAVIACSRRAPGIPYAPDQYQYTATMFETKPLPTEPDAIVPDGSAVRILARLSGGSIANFQRTPRDISCRCSSRCREIWFVLSGRGEMWRKHECCAEQLPEVGSDIV
jgi:mannose-6-phosphate isomerase-like protein (cupin superfamily)